MKGRDVKRSGLKLGALGGPQTFSAQFAKVMLERYPEFAEIVYYPTSDEAMDAALRGAVDATCAPEQMSTTGFHPGMQARMAAPDCPLHVAAEISYPYHCALLGKPGARLGQVRRVLGHTGSIAQSRPWIAAHLTDVEIEIVDTHSLVAARSVVDGDGSVASVGTLELARTIGLAALATDIDGGCIGNYWAVSRAQLFSELPTRVVVAGRFGDGGPRAQQLTRLIGAVAAQGYVLQTVSSRATGQALYEYDCVLRFTGAGSLAAVRAALAPSSSTRLVGAWEARG